MIIRVLIFHGERIDSLCPDLHSVFDQIRFPIIGEAGDKLSEGPTLLDLPKEQTAAVAGDRSLHVQLRLDLASRWRVKLKETLCS